MDISDIRLLRTVSEEGSLTRAAEVLHISQPTLSRKLARLESQLKTKLFSRSPTGVVATEVARYIVASSHALDAQIRQIERHVEQLTQLESGEIRLGVGPIIEQVLLPEVIAKFVAATGNVRLSIITGHADTLLRRLSNADLDIIAGPFRPGDHPNLAAFPLITDTLVEVVRSQHPVIATKQPQEIEQYPLASPEPQGSVTGGSVPETTLRKRIACENYPLLKNLTLNSDCVCRGPWYVFRDELKSGTLREIESKRPVRWESACLVRRESVETPLVKLLVDLLVDGSRNYLRR